MNLQCIRLLGHFTSRMANCIQHLLYQILCFSLAINTITTIMFLNTSTHQMLQPPSFGIKKFKNRVNKRINQLTSNPLYHGDRRRKICRIYQKSQSVSLLLQKRSHHFSLQTLFLIPNYIFNTSFFPCHISNLKKGT